MEATLFIHCSLDHGKPWIGAIACRTISYNGSPDEHGTLIICVYFHPPDSPWTCLILWSQNCRCKTIAVAIYHFASLSLCVRGIQLVYFVFLWGNIFQKLSQIQYNLIHLKLNNSGQCCRERRMKNVKTKCPLHLLVSSFDIPCYALQILHLWAAICM